MCLKIKGMSDECNLTIDDELRLVTGNGLWHTSDCGGKLTALRVSDGPHGLRMQPQDSSMCNESVPATCFPLSCALAASWDTEAVRESAAAIAEEAEAAGVSIVLGPGTNIKRSPLCGRNFEYFSEDPFLSGKLAAAFINAVQETGVGTSLKHFAGNSQEKFRMTSDSCIDERALREIYLTAFEIAVKESSPATIMSSYNKVNGIYACENSHLLTDILRKEWGFDGVVMSDWGACIDLAACLRAGMDLEMPDSCGYHTRLLKKELEAEEAGTDKNVTSKNESSPDSGTSLRQAISTAASRLTALSRKYGPLAKNESDRVDFTLPADMLSEHHRKAVSIASRCAVLLKNDGILPVPEGKQIIVAGPLAEDMHVQGGGSSHINMTVRKNAVQALTQAGYTVTQADNAMVLKESHLSMDIPLLFFCGLTDTIEGEGFDRKTMSIPDEQIALFDELYAVHQNIIVICLAGAPVTLPFTGRARAILLMYLSGQATAEAMADLISGKANPSGKLPETWPFSEKDTPCHDTFATNSRIVQYRESIFTGYRYYDTFGIPVAWPFGFGLSYTTFSYSDLTCASAYTGGSLDVSVTVRNEGSVAGAETVQFYVKNPECTYIRASRELRAFTKVHLEPGESRTVTVTLNERSFSLYDGDAKSFIMPSGVYEVQAASSLDDVRASASVTVKGTEYRRDDRELLPAYFERNGKPLEIPEEQFAALYGKHTRPLPVWKEPVPGEFTVKSSLKQMTPYSLLARLMLKIAQKEAFRLNPGCPPDDPSVQMVLETTADGTIDCITCQSEGMAPYRLTEAIILGANGKKFRAFLKLIFG